MDSSHNITNIKPELVRPGIVQWPPASCHVAAGWRAEAQ